MPSNLLSPPFPHEEKVSRFIAVGRGIWGSLLYSPICPVIENTKGGGGRHSSSQPPRGPARHLKPGPGVPGRRRTTAERSAAATATAPSAPADTDGDTIPGRHEEGEARRGRAGPGRLPPSRGGAQTPNTPPGPHLPPRPSWSRLLRGCGRKSRLCCRRGLARRPTGRCRPGCYYGRQTHRSRVGRVPPAVALYRGAATRPHGREVPCIRPVPPPLPRTREGRQQGRPRARGPPSAARALAG